MSLRRRADAMTTTTAGCISGVGCVLATIVGNILFWGALLWVLIQILKNQGVIR